MQECSRSGPRTGVLAASTDGSGTPREPMNGDARQRFLAAGSFRDTGADFLSFVSSSMSV
jgi:hypothetical protein